MRTLEIWGNVRREHLIAWRAASGEDDTDAVTGATRSSHGTHLVEWDLQTLAGAPAEPGLYRIYVEYTEDNSNGSAPAGPRVVVEFELGAGPTITWTPTAGDADRFAELLFYAP